MPTRMFEIMKPRVRSVVLVATGAFIGWMGGTGGFVADVDADVREGKSPVAFKSGGERSVVVLEKISKQITTLDQRLARIEATVTGQAQK